MQLPEFLQVISKQSITYDQDIYLVGGALRDIIINNHANTVKDWDILCSQSAIDFARYLESQSIATIINIHEPFGTAQIQLINTQQILDLATCRSEIYTKSGALPIVEYPVDIKQDLQRRDFTINSLAYNLNTQEFVDIYNSQQDIQSGIIQVLHPKSYYEDPTRILRAIRFAHKLNFQIHHNNIQLIQDITDNRQFHNFIQNIRGLRFGIELEYIINLPSSQLITAIQQLTQLKIWHLFSTQWQEYFEQLDNAFDYYQNINLNNWEYKLFALLINNTQTHQDTDCKIYQLLGFSAQVIKHIKYLLQYIQQDNLKQPSLKLVKTIKQLPSEHQYDIQQIIMNYNNLPVTYWTDLYQAIPTTSGNELQEQGYYNQDIAIELQRLFECNLVKILKGAQVGYEDLML